MKLLHGTGTLSMWSGCSCSCACTGSDICRFAKKGAFRAPFLFIASLLMPSFPVLVVATWLQRGQLHFVVQVLHGDDGVLCVPHLAGTGVFTDAAANHLVRHAEQVMHLFR